MKLAQGSVEREEGGVSGRSPVLSRPSPDPQAADLKGLLEAYEKSLILAALAAAGGRQRSAASLLRILPTTLNEKMRRLGIGRHRIQRVSAAPTHEACASVRWTGTLPPGGTLEIRGLNGPVRIEAGSTDEIEVLARRSGPRRVLSAVEVKILEHSRGVTICAVCQEPGLPPRAAHRPLLRAVTGVRVALTAKVPPGIHVVASTVNDDVEILGVAGNVEAHTANGRVRFLTSPPPVQPTSTGGEQDSPGSELLEIPAFTSTGGE